MTATASPPQPPPSAAPASDLPPAPARPGARPTPVLLRGLAIACVVSAVVAGIFLSVVSLQRASRLEDAADKARQVVVLSDARSQVAAADAAATRAFLVGGVEDAEGRTAYLDALAAATADLTTAAASGIGNADTIGSIAEGVGSYRGTVEYARALNRQNRPLGSAYLRSAGQGLATAVVDPLDAEIAEVRGSIQTNAPVVTVTLTVVAVAAFLGCFWWASKVLSRHTRRTLNVGVVLGGLVVGAVVLALLVVTVGITSTVDDAVDGPLRDTTQLAQVRTDVFDARSALNLALIARGSGATFLQRLDDDLADASARVATVTGPRADRIDDLLDAFAAETQAVRDVDSTGDYDGAVLLATSPDDGVGPAFDELDEVSAQVLSSRATEATDDLTSGRPWLLVLAVGGVIAGLLGAAAAWSGIGQRRKEYL
jgi:hypothetical protein